MQIVILPSAGLGVSGTNWKWAAREVVEERLGRNLGEIMSMWYEQDDKSYLTCPGDRRCFWQQQLPCFSQKNCLFFSSIIDAETFIFTVALQVYLAPESLGVRHTLLYNIFWLIRIRCSSITNVSIIAHHDPVQTSIGFHLIPFEQFALLGGLARLTPRSLTEQSHHSWANLRAKSMLIAPVLKRILLFISHCFPVLFLTRGSFAVIQVNFQQENSHGDHCGGGTKQT